MRYLRVPLACVYALKDILDASDPTLARAMNFWTSPVSPEIVTSLVSTGERNRRLEIP